MNNIIEIVEFKNRISFKEDYEPIICGNTNYYLKFTFDELWSDLENKQVIVEIKGKKIILDIDEENKCKLPALPNALKCHVMVKCSTNDETYVTSVLKLDLEPNMINENVELMEQFSGYCSKLFNSVDKIAIGDLTVNNAHHAEISDTSETQVSKTGDEEISGIKSFNDEIKKAGKIVPNTTEVSNPNLLSNPEMRINQRGKTRYEGKNVYFADRWKLFADNAYAQLTDSGKWNIGISAGNHSIQVFCKQEIENYEFLMGKYVTFSLSLSGVTLLSTGLSKLVLVVDDGVANKYFEAPKTSEINVAFTTLISENAKKLVVELETSYAAAPFNFIFNWAKLEVGKHATAFSPKIYNQDFMDCQRYYQNVRLSGGASAASSTSALYSAIPLPVSMRTKPTIVSYTVPSVRGNGRMFDATSISMNSIYDNEVVLNVYGGGNMTQYEIFALHNGECCLDAEIY